VTPRARLGVHGSIFVARGLSAAPRSDGHAYDESGLSNSLRRKVLTADNHEGRLGWAGGNTMTTRTHQTLRIGLRKIIRDPRASVRTRLQAIRLLIDVEGLRTSTKNMPASVKNGSNSKKLKQLLAMTREQKPEEGLPDASGSALRQ
jgi:hypothetical protein